MMKRRRKRKCLNCQALFHPDYRNIRHQKYCSESECRKVSKAASQRRWLTKESNKNYFRGSENVQRVQVWRLTHPGYWRSRGLLTDSALQDDSLAQAIESNGESEVLASTTLQDLLNQKALFSLGCSPI